MKKIIITIIAICMIALTGCSCVPENSLSFTNAWNSGNDATTMTETTTYKVNYSDNFTVGNYSFKKGDGVTNFFRYDQGTYTETLKVINKSDSSIPAELENNDILSDIESTVLYLHTEFFINVYYTYADKTDELHEEKVVTDVFFGTASASFTPIYAKSVSKHTLVSKSESISIDTVNTEYVSIFSKNSYKITSKIDKKEPTETTYEKGYKKYIDNTELLFAIRNMTLTAPTDEQGQTQASMLPTVSPVYGDAQDLAITHFDGANETVTVNGTEYSIPCKYVSMGLGTTSNSGRSQLLFIQNGKVENLFGGENRSVMVKYVYPLMTYGSFDSMGALIYTLESVVRT